MKKWTVVAALLVIATIAALPATAGNGKGKGNGSASTSGGGGGGASIAPANWWSPVATLSAAGTGETSNTGAVSWQDCLSVGDSGGSAVATGNCITFAFQTNYSDPTGGTGPWLQLQCFRAGADYEWEGQLSGSMILADSRAGFEGGWGYGVPFVLNGTAWHKGPANCTAQVGHMANSGKFMVEASTSFFVAG